MPAKSAAWSSLVLGRAAAPSRSTVPRSVAVSFAGCFSQARLSWT